MNNKLKLCLNDSVVFQYKYESNPGKFYGIRYVFNGLGEVDYIRFRHAKGDMLLNEDFN